MIQTARGMSTRQGAEPGLELTRAELTCEVGPAREEAEAVGSVARLLWCGRLSLGLTWLIVALPACTDYFPEHDGSPDAADGDADADSDADVDPDGEADCVENESLCFTNDPCHITFCEPRHVDADEDGCVYFSHDLCESDGCCPSACNPLNDADCFPADRSCGDLDGVCPGSCSAGQDYDCCADEVCGPVDGCCPPGCAPGEDEDCVNACEACDPFEPDGCCPAMPCESEDGDDFDCCEQGDAPCSSEPNGCCPLRCSNGNDVDCCERNGMCGAFDGCCPSICFGPGADPDCP